VRLLRAGVAVLFVGAMAGLGLTAAFGFEQPNDLLLFLSSGFLLVAIAAVFTHLGTTRTLTRSQKRIWLDQLASRRAAWAFGEYLTCEDLRAAATRLAEEGSNRRASSP
jgi:hypothetical protein